MENFGSWSVLTTNFIIVLYLALAGVTFASILHLANGKWRFQVRYFAVSTAALFPLAFVLLLVLLGGGEHTFPWLAQAHDGQDDGVHLSGWLDYSFLVVREIVGFVIVAVLFGLFIKYQHLTAVSDDPVVHRRFRNIALLIPFVYVL
ncbi:MAG TPA: polysulfide reductase, NrfD, partial [Chromatiales bacterium]|nr:polysulfide reductase, NrfD [Chromatiales bacterium]HEX22577.1 polysulfide reductase, NrfD [Chromatiales bacterium]